MNLFHCTMYSLLSCLNCLYSPPRAPVSLLRSPDIPNIYSRPHLFSFQSCWPGSPHFPLKNNQVVVTASPHSHPSETPWAPVSPAPSYTSHSPAGRWAVISVTQLGAQRFQEGVPGASSWASAGRREGPGCKLGTPATGPPLGLCLEMWGPKEPGRTVYSKEGWTGLAGRKQPLTGRPGNPKPGGPTSPLVPAEGLSCWAPTAGLQDKQESPWRRKRRDQKGSQ